MNPRTMVSTLSSNLTDQLVLVDGQCIDKNASSPRLPMAASIISVGVQVPPTNNRTIGFNPTSYTSNTESNRHPHDASSDVLTAAASAQSTYGHDRGTRDVAVQTVADANLCSIGVAIAMKSAPALISDMMSIVEGVEYDILIPEDSDGFVCLRTIDGYQSGWVNAEHLFLEYPTEEWED